MPLRLTQLDLSCIQTACTEAMSCYVYTELVLPWPEPSYEYEACMRTNRKPRD